MRLSGEVVARRTINLSFQVSGRVQSRWIELGDRVDTNQLLAELDPVDLRSLKVEQEERLRSAHAAYALAKIERQRFVELASRGVVSQSLLDSKKLELRAARTRWIEARTARDIATNQVNYASLRAPASGTVVSLLIEESQIIAAGSRVLTLALDGPREIGIEFPESYRETLHVGQELLFETSGTEKIKATATLRELAATTDPSTRLISARLTVNANSENLKLGQRVVVSEAIASESIWLVPLLSVVQNNQNPRVWVLDESLSKIRAVPLVISQLTESGALVQADLRINDWLITAGAHLLNGDESVHALDSNNRPIQRELDLSR